MIYIKINVRIAMVSTAALAMLPFLPSIGLSGIKSKALEQCNFTRREPDNKRQNSESAESAPCQRRRSIIELDCENKI